MGNTCKAARPPPYAKKPPQDFDERIEAATKRALVESPDRAIACRALNTALVAFANSDSMDSYEAVVQHRKVTVQALSAIVYGKSIKWMSMAAYVITARELDPDCLVLPDKYAAPFLDTR